MTIDVTSTNLIAFVGMILVAGSTIWRVSNLLSDMEKRIFLVVSALDKRVQAVETKMELFWGAMGAQAAAMLHSPHSPELDDLLEKVMNHTITPVEARELRELEELELARLSSLPGINNRQLVTFFLLEFLKRKEGGTE